MDIAEFLLARIAEDEFAALAADSDRGEWYAVGETRLDTPAEEAFVLRNSPARVLAECEVKRRIVELHRHEETRFEAIARATGSPPLADPYRACVECGERDGDGDLVLKDGTYCTTLRLLALPYANHPDFDPAWSALAEV